MNGSAIRLWSLNIRTGHMIRLKCFVQTIATYAVEPDDTQVDEFAYNR